MSQGKKKITTRKISATNTSTGTQDSSAKIVKSRGVPEVGLYYPQSPIFAQFLNFDFLRDKSLKRKQVDWDQLI